MRLPDGLWHGQCGDNHFILSSSQDYCSSLAAGFWLLGPHSFLGFHSIDNRKRNTVPRAPARGRHPAHLPRVTLKATVSWVEHPGGHSHRAVGLSRITPRDISKHREEASDVIHGNVLKSAKMLDANCSSHGMKAGSYLHPGMGTKSGVS